MSWCSLAACNFGAETVVPVWHCMLHFRGFAPVQVYGDAEGQLCEHRIQTGVSW